MTVFRPKILNKNFISVSEISDSSASDIENFFKLIDKNDELLYQTFGFLTGTRTITWTPSSSTEIDRIIIQGINWKDFNITYDSGTPFSTAISFTNNTKTDFYFEFNLVGVTSVVFSITDTFVTGDIAKVGQIVCTREIFEFSGSLGHKIKDRESESQRIIVLSDSTVSKTFIRDIYNYSIDLENVRGADLANFQALKQLNRRQQFIFIKEPATYPDTWDSRGYHYNMVKYKLEAYSMNLKLNGRMGSIELSQGAG